MSIHFNKELVLVYKRYSKEFSVYPSTCVCDRGCMDGAEMLTTFACIYYKLSSEGDPTVGSALSLALEIHPKHTDHAQL